MFRLVNKLISNKILRWIVNIQILILMGLFVITTLGLLTPTLRTNKADLNNNKIIEWGWSTPTPKYMKSHIEEMEKLPFDGLVVNIYDGKTIPFGNKVWSNKVLKIEDYSQSIEDLRTTKFYKFKENFLRFNVMPGEVDWYEQDFESVIANAKVAAKIAKDCGLKGILFDVEYYDTGKPFDYFLQAKRDDHSFIDYQKQVRLRGQEFMQAINSMYPNIIIFLPYGYQLPYRAFRNKNSLESSLYALLPSFLDGMLEAASSDTLFFDGWEYAYGYKNESEFSKAYNVIREGIDKTKFPEKFIKHYRASFGLWLDYKQVWDRNNLTKNYFTPEDFKNSVRLALKYTDRYVWIRTEKAGWWRGDVPQPYIDALIEARKP